MNQSIVCTVVVFKCVWKEGFLMYVQLVFAGLVQL